MAKKTINRYMNPRNENDATCYIQKRRLNDETVYSI